MQTFVPYFSMTISLLTQLFRILSHIKNNAAITLKISLIYGRRGNTLHGAEAWHLAQVAQKNSKIRLNLLIVIDFHNIAHLLPTNPQICI